MPERPPAVSPTAAVVAHLTQPLIQFLESNPNLLFDADSQKCLLKLHKIVEQVLLGKNLIVVQENGQPLDHLSKFLSAATTNSSVDFSERKTVSSAWNTAKSNGYSDRYDRQSKREAEAAAVDERSISQSPGKPWERYVDGNSINVQRVDMKDCTRSIKVLPTRGRDGSGDGNEPRPPQEIGLRRKVLVSVCPYEEMGEEESNTNMMMIVFGQSFNRWYFRHKTLGSLLFVVALIFNSTSTLTFLFLYDDWIPYGWLMAIGVSFGCCIFVLQYFSRFNAQIIKRCLRSFDARILFVEAALFSLALWSMTCFSAPALPIACGCFLLCMPYILYDGYSTGAKNKSKKFLVFGALQLITLLTIFYGRLYTTTMCYYKLDLTYGLTLMPSQLYQPTSSNKNSSSPSIRPSASSDCPATTITAAMPLSSRWSLSLFEFCLNRGVTLLILMLKVIYAAYKHPLDCAIIKTPIRVVEPPSSAKGSSTGGATKTGSKTASNTLSTTPSSSLQLQSSRAKS